MKEHAEYHAANERPCEPTDECCGPVNWMACPFEDVLGASTNQHAKENDSDKEHLHIVLVDR